MKREYLIMPTLRNLFVIVAKEVTTDAGDQMISIFKITDKFNIEVNAAELKKTNNLELGKDPITFPVPYSIATSWLFDEKLKKDTFVTYRTNLIDPLGKEYMGMEQEQMVASGLNKMNVNFNIHGLPVTQSGFYRFIVEAKSKDGKILAKGEYPFEIEIKETVTKKS